MVVVEEITKLSERRTHTSSEVFPDGALASIRSAVEAVPASVFDGATKHTEVGGFDATIADGALAVRVRRGRRRRLQPEL